MFIRYEELVFNDYKEFYKRRFNIKKQYNIFYKEYSYTKEIGIYRDYIYSKDMQELEKNAIWDYLNDYLEVEKLRSKYKSKKKV